MASKGPSTWINRVCLIKANLSFAAERGYREFLRITCRPQMCGLSRTKANAANAIMRSQCGFVTPFSAQYMVSQYRSTAGGGTPLRMPAVAGRAADTPGHVKLSRKGFHFQDVSRPVNGISGDDCPVK